MYRFENTLKCILVNPSPTQKLEYTIVFLSSLCVTQIYLFLPPSVPNWTEKYLLD